MAYYWYIYAKIHSGDKNKDSAIKYYENSLNILQGIQSPSIELEIAYIYELIGTIYSVSKEMPQEGLDYFVKQRKIYDDQALKYV